MINIGNYNVSMAVFRPLDPSTSDLEIMFPDLDSDIDEVRNDENDENEEKTSDLPFKICDKFSK